MFLMSRIRTVAICSAIGAATLIGCGQSAFADEPHTPARGSPERKAIMDALRPTYQAETSGQITFVVNYLKVHDGWAWTDVTPLGSDNKAVAEGGPALLHYDNDVWKAIDLSTIPEDPKDPLGPEDASPGFIRNLRKMYPDVPLDIFPKKKH
jgi:hypothetical protein